MWSHVGGEEVINLLRWWRILFSCLCVFKEFFTTKSFNKKLFSNSRNLWKNFNFLKKSKNSNLNFLSFSVKFLARSHVNFIPKFLFYFSQINWTKISIFHNTWSNFFSQIDQTCRQARKNLACDCCLWWWEQHGVCWGKYFNIISIAIFHHLSWTLRKNKKLNETQFIEA